MHAGNSFLPMQAASVSTFSAFIIIADERLPKAVIIRQKRHKHCKKSPHSDQSDSSGLSSSDCSDDEMYQKKYNYIKSLAKRLITVHYYYYYYRLLCDSACWYR